MGGRERERVKQREGEREQKLEPKDVNHVEAWQGKEAESV